MPPDGILSLLVLILLAVVGAVLTVCGVGVRSKRNDDESSGTETESDIASTATSSEAFSGSGGYSAYSESDTSLTTDYTPGSTTSDDDEYSAYSESETSLTTDYTPGSITSDDDEPPIAVVTDDTDRPWKRRMRRRLAKTHRTEEKIRGALLSVFEEICTDEGEVDMDECINSLRPILNAAIKNPYPLRIMIYSTRRMLDSKNWKDRAAALIGFVSVEIPKMTRAYVIEAHAFFNDEHEVVREAAYRVALETFLSRFDGCFLLGIHPTADEERFELARTWTDSYCGRTQIEMFLRVMEEAVRMLSGPNLLEKQCTIHMVILLRYCYGNSAFVRKHGLLMKQLFVDSLIDPLKRMLGEECTELQANALSLIAESVECVGKEFINANKEEMLNLISPHLGRIILEESEQSFDWREMVEIFESLPEMIVGSLIPLALAPLPEKDDLKDSEYDRIKQSKTDAINQLGDMGDYAGMHLSSHSYAFAPYVDELSQLMVDIDVNELLDVYSELHSVYLTLLLTLVNALRHRGSSAKHMHWVQCWRLLKEAYIGESDEKVYDVILKAAFCHVLCPDMDKEKVTVLDVESITELVKELLEEHIKNGKEMTNIRKDQFFYIITKLFRVIGAPFCFYFARFGKLMFNDRIDLGLDSNAAIVYILIDQVPDFALLYNDEIKDVINASLSSESPLAINKSTYAIGLMAASHRFEWKLLAAASIDKLYSIIHRIEDKSVRSGALRAVDLVLNHCKSIDMDSKNESTDDAEKANGAEMTRI